MNVRYFGQKAKDIFGDPLKRAESPCAVVSFTSAEETLAIARLEYTGYQFNIFGDGADGCIYVDVADRDDYDDFMAEWKEAKKTIGKADLK